MKRLVVDLDNTLTMNDTCLDYREKKPNIALIEKLREYKAQGFEIFIQTSRNMQTYNGSIGKINVHTLPIIMKWLDEYKIPYDEIYVGKPWCGEKGFYIDDKAIRPSEFISLSLEAINRLIGVPE